MTTRLTTAPLVCIVLCSLVLAYALPMPATAARTAATPGAVHALPAMACAQLATKNFSTIPDASLRIFTAIEQAATDATAATCQVTGTIAANAQFVLQLPSNDWDGRYYQSGCGGYCGNLSPNADCQQALGRGAAIGYSDLGTTGMQDLSWTEDEGARQDFAYAANHELAVAAKAIINVFYGHPPAHAYFIGCSDGGREALMEAQRFPDDFDGIVAGAPAYLLAFLNSYKHTWQYRANTGADGNPIITADQAAVLHEAVLDACDDTDGLADGLIFDPRACTFDPAGLLCPAPIDAAGCLTQAQVDAARRLYSAPTDANGVRYYPAATLPYGSELRWVGGGGPTGEAGNFDKMIADVYLGSLSLPLPWQDPNWNADSLELRPRDVFALLPMAAVYDASNPDLAAFRDRGGKLILYHGWADDSISPEGTVAYYDALQQQMGGSEATLQFARLFMFPGVYHCSGGYGPSHFDMVDPITNWVERGIAPEQIIATQYASDLASAGGGFANPTQIETPTGSTPPAAGATPAAMGEQPGGVAVTAPSGAVVRTLPAFPYPLQPQYTGSGDINDARNYVPVLPSGPVQDAGGWIGQDLGSDPA
ncbi:MAG: tannase/feruloyl esterase family alpha/beta hydrolase [Thermomicrobiales bacterium]